MNTAGRPRTYWALIFQGWFVILFSGCATPPHGIPGDYRRGHPAAGGIRTGNDYPKVTGGVRGGAGDSTGAIPDVSVRPGKTKPFPKEPDIPKRPYPRGDLKGGEGDTSGSIDTGGTDSPREWKK